MRHGTDPESSVSHDARTHWLREEYRRLYEAARPLLKEHTMLLARATAVAVDSERIAQMAFGTLLALGMPEQEARKELQSWRKLAE